MFRKIPKPAKTDQFDTIKIQQHIATINFLADMLRYSASHHSMHSHLAVLTHAIKKFEKHRFADYTLNNTERAEQVLHTRKIYNALYKQQLKHSRDQIIAKALKSELKTYASSVKSTISAIKDDLKSSLLTQHQVNMENQDADMLNHDFDVLRQEAIAYRLKAQLANLDETEEDYSNANSLTEEVSSLTVSDEEGQDEGYDFYGVQDMDLSDEVVKKPYLRGSFNFSDDETTPLLGRSFSSDEEFDARSSRDCSTTELIDSAEFLSSSESNSPSSSRLFRFSQESDNENEVSLDSATESDTEENDMPPRPFLRS